MSVNYVYGNKIRYECDVCGKESYYKTQETGRPCGYGCKGIMKIMKVDI